MKLVVVLLPLFLGFCLADLPTDIPDIDNELDDIEEIKERCEKKGGQGTYDKVKKAIDETKTCVQGIVDISKIKDELDEAKGTGSMDEVFGKYCGKRSQVKECVKKSTDAIQPCLEESEKTALNTTMRIVSQVGDFACHNDGDRLAMFVAEGGVECLKARAEGIKTCFNQTLKFNPATFSPKSLSTLPDKKKCDNLVTIQNCIVKDLEDNCKDKTPANIIDALFRFVKNSACKDIKRRRRGISLGRQIRSALTKTPEQLKTEIQEKLKATCEQNGNNESYDKLMASFNESRACVGTQRIFAAPYNVYQNNFVNCTAKVRKALEDCLPEEGKYYADFLLEEVQSLVKFAYAHTNKIFAATPENMEFANCMKALTQEDPQKEAIQCFKQVEEQESNILKIEPKAKICEKTIRVDLCLKNLVKNTCIKDIRISNFVEELFKAIEAPCSQKTISDNEA